MSTAEDAERVISDVGKRLAALKSCPNKDVLVKLLKQAASAFQELDQLASLRSAVKPLSDSLVKHHLLQHKDKDIRLLVGICFTGIIRVLAPNPDFTDEVLKDIFKLFLSLFMELADTKAAYFHKRLEVLETVAKLNVCVLMLDIGSEDLVVKMFNIFFAVVREKQPNMFGSMSSIMTVILKEKVSQPLIDVVLWNLLKEGKGTSPAAYELAVFVIKYCAVEVERHVCQFLSSCIMNRDAVRSELKEFYHDIVFEIFKCAPQMLLVVIPNLTQELLADQVDVRIKAVNLIGKLLSEPGNRVAQEYHHVFIEFLRRFSDKSVEVRLVAISWAKSFYMTNPSGRESLEVLTALEDRLLDFDDRVRNQAVIIACDLAISTFKSIPQLISRTTERLRDKKVSVRKTALQNLLKVYCDYCLKCSGNIMKPSDSFEKIPCRILMLCYDKDCKDFRTQSMELVLAEELFPPSLSIEDRTMHWIRLFSHFNSLHLKVLNTILSQKQRLQTEMQAFLAFRKNKEDILSEEAQQRIRNSASKISALFPDSTKAEQCFHQLNLLEDNSIFTMIAELLEEVTIESAQRKRDNFLEKIGDKHPLYGFLRLLSTKCLLNIFSSDNVHFILDHLLGGKLGSDNQKGSSMQLLLAIINAFPSTLRGCEEKFQLLLLEDDISFKEELIQILEKAGPHIQIKLSNIYPILERVCLEGTRSQAKLAVSAIAALSDASRQLVFSELCKTLVDALHGGKNIPTVLQSLGSLAQHSISTFENQDGDISQYIVHKFFLSTDEDMSNYADSSIETSDDSIPCKWKVLGLRALVKSFLPHRSSHVRRDISQFLDVLSKLLQKGYVSEGVFLSESDKTDIRLAAAKAVLQLSRRWDLHIAPHIFRSTVLMAKDSSSFVRRQFIDKIYKLLKRHALPWKFACAFALAASDSLKDLQDDSMKYMEEFIREYNRGAQIRQTSAKQLGVTDYPAYIVVFLIHLLAHDLGFPPGDCEDEEVYAQFLRPLVFTLQALLNASSVDGGVDSVNATILCLRGIFLAIKKTTDAVDVHITPKLHILAEFGICTLNALGHSTTCPLHNPAPILLPSSFYRICHADKSDEVNINNANWSHFNAKIVKRVFLSFGSHISLPHSMLIKHGHQYEDDLQSDSIKCSTSKLHFCKGHDLLMNDIREQNESTTNGKQTDETVKQKISTGGRQNRAHSPSLPGSVELHKEFDMYDEQEKFSSGNCEPHSEREELPSSSDSVITKPLAAQKGDVKRSASLTLRGTVTKTNSIGAKCSKSTKLTALGGTKDVGRNSQLLVGQRIKLWSPVDKCYYLGTVAGFDPRDDIHKIDYDNGEVEVVNLETENWEIINNYSLQEKETSSCNSQDHLTTLVDVCHKRSFPTERKGKIVKRKIPLPGKENKVLKYSADTCASEVINVNEDSIARRTRQRK